ncbi:MAG: carnitine 3-dehydrogenase [Woeseia sp.]
MTDRSSARAAIVGGGVIGGGWAARFLLHGWQVSVFDPHPEAARRMKEVLHNARASAPALADYPMPAEGKLEFAATLADAVTGADWIQESVPEDLSLKHAVLAEIQSEAPESAFIASSTSGFKPSELQKDAVRPGQIIVAHPFNPVYLLPLVEVVGGPAVREDLIDRVCDTLKTIGMKPLVVRKEIDAHIADRLLESVWREALWLVNDDVATTGEIDDAIRFGFGLRWAQMGLFETYRLAGGEAGMAHFISQFGPTLAWPWSRLTDVPDLTDELVQKIAGQSDAESGDYSIRELERIRDRNLVGMLRALKERDWGAGAVLNEHDQDLRTERTDDPAVEAGAPLRILDLTVLPAWIDYNGHMTEFRYVQVFSDSCDKLLLMIGMDADYVANTGAWYTIETHAMYIDEVGVNQPIYSTAQVLMADAKRMHVFYYLRAAEDDRVLSTMEAMYLHVARKSGRASDASPEMVAAIEELANAHENMPRPEAAGRQVGQRKRG